MELQKAIPSSTSQRIEFLELFTGWDEDGRDVWCYIAIQRERYSEFKKLVTEGADIQPEEFGLILRQGTGLLPPPDVRKEVSVQYGFDHAFERRINELLNSISKGG